MTNSELLSKVIEDAEKVHKNFYHAISKEDLRDYIEAIKSQTDFDNLNGRELLVNFIKIFAKIGDAHTRCLANSRRWLDAEFIYIKNKLYFHKDDDFKLVKKIAGEPVAKVLAELSEFCCFDTPEGQTDLLREVLNNGFYYHLLGMGKDDKISCVVIDDNGNKQAETIGIYPWSRAEELDLIKPEPKNMSLRLLVTFYILIIIHAKMMKITL